ncbi:MAG: flavodoxin [Ruminiclostridium sp.]|nr:flavodoxin [Ruminiclostridium sp.]
MKTAIVYYSMLGNTDYVAQKIAPVLNADIIRIEPEKAYPDKGFKKFFWGGKSAVMGDAPALLPYTFDAEKYDRIIFGTPIWAGTFAPPLKTFLADNKELIKDKQISVFTSSSGGGADKAIEKIKKLIEIDKIEATLHLIDPKDRPKEENDRKIDGFCSLLT